MKPVLSLTLFLLAAPASMAAAQGAEKEKPRRIVRVGFGAEIVPDHVGAKGTKWSPLFNLDRKREGETFEFEAPDESFGFGLARIGSLEVGPALALESSRKPSRFAVPVEKVGTTVEAGAFVQTLLGEHFRVRAEARKGLGGHEGWISQLSADLIAREGDAYIVSIGPRLTLADRNYQEAYFSVTPATAAASGLPRFDPDGGVRGVGLASAVHFEIAPRWGLYGYGRFERLIGDAGRSPLIRAYGSRNQLSAGLALTYTFGL